MRISIDETAASEPYQGRVTAKPKPGLGAQIKSL